MREILTQNLLLGMNIVTLIGFTIMLLGMRAGRPTALRRSFGSPRFIGNQRTGLSTALMGAGTVLVILGIYLTPR